MDKINAETAVSHIDNSLDNTNANYWKDEEAGILWSVQGRRDIFEFMFTDDDDEIIAVQRFRLVPLDD